MPRGVGIHLNIGSRLANLGRQLTEAAQPGMRASGRGPVEVVLPGRPVAGVRAVVDDLLGAAPRRQAAQVGAWLAPTTRHHRSGNRVRQTAVSQLAGLPLTGLGTFASIDNTGMVIT